MRGLWLSVVLATTLLVSGCVLPDESSGPKMFEGPAFKSKAMEALTSVRSYNYTTQSIITILPLPVSAAGSDQAVSPLRTVSIKQGTMDNAARSIIESSWDTDVGGGTKTASTVAVGDFVYSKNFCTGGWSKQRVTSAETKEFIGGHDSMSNFTAQLFNISTLEWKEKTRLGDRDVHLVMVVPDKEKMLSLFPESVSFSENVESFDATYWLETGTLYPVKGEVTMTFNIPPNGSEPGYSVEMKVAVDYSNHNRVAPIALPKEAEGAREATAGSGGISEETIYIAKSAGYSICPPKGYPKEDIEGAQSFTANVYVRRLASSGDFDADVKLAKEDINQESSLQLISDKAVALASGRGHLFEYTASDRGIKLRSLMLLTPNPADENTIFLVGFAALDSAWSKHKDAAMASLLSFQSKASPTPGTPSPPPISPSIALVKLNPQQLLLTADQFHLPGYSVTDDEAVGNNGWRRAFSRPSESSEYQWVDSRIFLLDAPPENYPSVSEACKVWEVGAISALDAPAVGDHVIACKITHPSTPQAVFRYRVYTRNVDIVLDTTTFKTSLTDDQVLNFLASLVQIQIIAIDRATASLTFQATEPPTKSPGPSTVPPTTLPPSPSISLVKLPPQQLLLTADQFPLPNYPFVSDEAVGNNGWSRYFGGNSTREYFFVSIKIYRLDELPTSYISPGDACKSSSVQNATSGATVDAPIVGDYAIACKFTFTNVKPLFIYYAYTRNVILSVQTRPVDDERSDSQVVDFLAALAQRQIVAIDQASPPELVTSPRGGPAFQFTAPSELSMKAGEYFEYSFCDPKPVYNTSPCGPIPPTKNPSGGNPPYHCVLGPGIGFPPFGLSLSKDCVLKGTVSKTEADKTHTIEVCAVDLSADAVCRKVTIRVEAPLPDCTGAQFEGTMWRGTFKSVSSGRTLYTGTFEFTFGTANISSWGCFVPIVSATVDDPTNKWAVDSKAVDPPVDSGLECNRDEPCHEFYLILGAPGGPGLTMGPQRSVTAIRMEAVLSAPNTISDTEIRGWAGTGGYGGGCCGGGSFTANRR